MDKVIYRYFSTYEFTMLLILRVCLLIGAGYAFSYILENPVVVSIVIIFCLAAIIFIGADQIIIYEDRIVQKTMSLAAYWFRFKETAYLFSDIKRAFIVTSKPDAFATGVIAALTLLIPRHNNRSSKHLIYLECMDGTTRSLLTNFDMEKRVKIVDEVNVLLHKNNRLSKKNR